MGRIFRKEGKGKKFSRMIKKVAWEVDNMWKKGLERNRERIEWSKRKFTVLKESEVGRKEWVRRVASGSGERRERVTPEVPVYGVVEPPLNEDELNALRLPPKHSLFLDVKIEEVRLQNDISDAKARWDRMSNRDFDKQGNEVTSEEDLSPKTMDQLIQENEIRERFDREIKTLDFRDMPPRGQE